ncbi:hypothetical protein KFL_000760100 [Klebsormidium nitens]|uniref:Dirigent protein n=1 Tax=Klebsormidium nitens TaxID=105231 RepID=A0A1Y1HWC0_KLENI|nr:hypothetical protein KFL_000760100 [Klebsormidium nitens]|eukprot:GAQ81281.1 hypothetical protein KFL_000760100 [Klebsormidium nitens]
MARILLAVLVSSLLLLLTSAAANKLPWVCESHSFHVWTNFSKPGPGPRHSAFPDPGIHVMPSGEEAVGDELVFNNNLYDYEDRTTVVGYVQGHCIRTVLAGAGSDHKPEFECYQTFVFNDKSMIATQGPVYDDQKINYPNIITGGIGRYYGARGVAHFGDDPDAQFDEINSFDLVACAEAQI